MMPPPIGGFKVPLRVQQFFCFWKLFVALNNCANFFGVLTNLNGFIGLRSCRFRAVLAISSVHDRWNMEILRGLALNMAEGV